MPSRAPEPTATTTPPPPLRAWTTAVAVVLPVALLLRLGQDANWDLRNYHLYGPHAWLHGRLAIDLAPAQQQTWHNPLFDVPLYLLRSAPGWVGSLWLAVPFVLALACLLRMYVRLARPAPTKGGVVALALLAATGAAAFSALGTTFNDAFVAAGVLAAGWVLVRAGTPRGRDWALAGVLAGAVAGGKLTAATYCVALAAAAAVAGTWREAPRRLAWLAVGGVAGFALTFAAWGLAVQHLHGSPVFPYFNDVFASPDAPPTAHADLRFRQDALGVVLAPQRLLVQTQRYSELVLRDPRLFLGLVAGAWLAWRHRGAPGARGFAAFFLVAFVLWGLQYGIYRYVLPLELLACLFVVLALQALPRGRSAALVVATLLVVAWTDHPNWGRTPFATSFARVAWPALPRDAMVVTAGTAPVAYAAIGLPDAVPMVSARNNFMQPDVCTALQARVEATLVEGRGPLFLLRTNEPADDAAEAQLAADYGLVRNGTCGTVVSNLGDLRLCPLRREPHPRHCGPPAAAPGR